jgi:1-acyl-sn-glycerol-3-phosphate acyltransferase
VSRLRSLLFFAWFFVLSVPLAILYVLLLILPRRAMLTGMSAWAHVVVASLHVLAGVRLDVRGREHIPRSPALVACKHQGWLDFVVLLTLLPDICFVMKKELMTIPVFGWLSSKAGMIPIDRSARSKALKDMLRKARERAREHRQILIFPEGTRTDPGATPDYKPGVAALYRDLDLPCTPVATNSGVHWPARGFGLTPGVAVYEFLPPIPPGLKREPFMIELQDRIETASNALL